MRTTLGLEGFTAGLRARRIYFRLYPLTLKMTFKNFKLWRFSCHIEPWLCAPTLKERLVCWNDGDVMLGSGRGSCG